MRLGLLKDLFLIPNDDHMFNSHRRVSQDFYCVNACRKRDRFDIDHTFSDNLPARVEHAIRSAERCSHGVVNSSLLLVSKYRPPPVCAHCSN